MGKKSLEDQCQGSPSRHEPNENENGSQKKDGSRQTKVINPQVQAQRNDGNINDFLGEPQQEVNENESTHSKKTNDYVKFFRYYYDRLKQQHPTWTTNQLTVIISLQWKKKKIVDKQPRPQQPSQYTRRSTKPLSAKEAFKMKHRQKGKEEIDQLWNKLPRESKNYWRKEGESYGNAARLSQISSVRNKEVQVILKNPMRMLLNQI